MSNPAPSERFSDRVDHYARYRPGYPPAALDVLRREIGLTPAWKIADVGSGTGISTKLFLQNGNETFAVEPNGPMRTAAERLLADYPRFHSVAATAEATALPSQSVDCVVVAQAFHWFDPLKTHAEFQRIVKPGGWIALFWNSRRLDSTPFLQAYEELLQRHGTDYLQVRSRNVDSSRLDAFFGPGRWAKRSVDNSQSLSLDGLRGRLLSSSYVPAKGDPAQETMLRELDRIYASHERQGRVVIEYDVEIYFGQIG